VINKYMHQSAFVWFLICPRIGSTDLQDGACCEYVKNTSMHLSAFVLNYNTPQDRFSELTGWSLLLEIDGRQADIVCLQVPTHACKQSGHWCNAAFPVSSFAVAEWRIDSSEILHE